MSTIDPLQAAEIAADKAYFAAEDAMLQASSAYSRCPRQAPGKVSLRIKYHAARQVETDASFALSLARDARADAGLPCLCEDR